MPMLEKFFLALMAALFLGCGPRLRIERIYGGDSGANQFEASTATNDSPREADAEVATEEVAESPPPIETGNEIGVANPTPPVLITDELPAHPFLRQPLDIVFAVDTSGSMLDSEITYVETNFDAMIKKLVSDKIDWQVTVIANDNFMVPAGLPATRFGVFDNSLDQDNLIGEVSQFFAAEEYVLPPRKNERLEIVVVSDGNPDSDESLAQDFTPPVARTFSVLSLTGPAAGPSATNPDCDIQEVGAEFKLLAEANKGAAFDLCDKNWSKLYSRLLSGVTNYDRSPYPLSAVPNLSMGFKVFVDGAEVDRAKYLVDSQRQLIQFDSTIEPSSTIKIEYYKN